MKQEQDAAYHESLAADRAKVQAEKERQNEEMEKMRQAQEVQDMREVCFDIYQLFSCKSMHLGLPPTP